MKFEKLFFHAMQIGMDLDYIVTGHYARIEYDAGVGRYLLKKAADETKDQSYVLYAITQERLAHTMFPLGEFYKSQIREIAESQGFVNAQKHDSQDICFVPDGDYARFIEQYTGQAHECGNFLDMQGNVLGRHKGLVHYTIGQRKGLGIAAPAPYYVCEHNVQDNTIILGSESDLRVHTLTVTDINLIPLDQIDGQIRAMVKVRYRQKGGWATVRQIDSDTLRIVFDEPQKGVAKGQAAVLYEGDYVLGGGTIVTTNAEASV